MFKNICKYAENVIIWNSKKNYIIWSTTETEYISKSM